MYFKKSYIEAIQSTYEQLSPKIPIPDLKLNKLDVADLNVAEYKLGQYSDQLDDLINQPTLRRNCHGTQYS